MPHRRLITTIFAMLAMALPLWAEAGSTTGGSDAAQGNNTIPTDLYTSPNSGLGIPSGQINVVPGQTTTNAVTKTPAAIPTDNTNMLGCGGVGQGEYTSALYNMPEAFAKFQQDVNSDLSKKMLTLNYASPQTAALFDQLNNYGQQRFQAFQQSCNLDALKQDAKKQYLDACVAKLTPDRKTIITNSFSQSGSSGSNGTGVPVEPMLSAMAYAQAWEVCSNQYVSDTTAVTMRKTMNDAFATQVRAVENVTEAIKPLLCGVTGTDGKSTVDGSNNGCWQALLIPQIRLCLDDTLGCTDTNGYNVNEPLLTMPRMFDTLRFLMDEIVVTRRVSDFSQQLITKSVNGNIQKMAANDATIALSNAMLGRLGTSGGTSTSSLIMGYGVNAIPDPSVSQFQLSYLNCKDADILTPLKEYAKQINIGIAANTSTATKTGTATATPATATTLTLATLAQSDYKPVIDKLGLTDASDNQKAALTTLAWTSLGCTANQIIPIFDPNLTASLQTQCLPQDRSAFYSVAEYDVSMAATRDIYRYLNLRLKQVYSRLLTQSTVPAATATTGATTGTAAAPTATVSPELNARLARAVKEIMIPQVEAQIDRLNELTQTRGEFAQRIQSIYKNKTGCMYAAPMYSAPNSRSFHDGNKE